MSLGEKQNGDWSFLCFVSLLTKWCGKESKISAQLVLERVNMSYNFKQLYYTHRYTDTDYRNWLLNYLNANSYNWCWGHTSAGSNMNKPNLMHNLHHLIAGCGYNCSHYYSHLPHSYYWKIHIVWALYECKHIVGTWCHTVFTHSDKEHTVYFVWMC